ncbi:hypothetical protein CR513_54404, partial [Mucuna pruriens]
MERKNISIEEMARTMLNDFNSPKPILKRLHMNCGREDNPTSLIFTLLDVNDNLGKFDPKSDKGTFFGYSTVSKAYRVYNSRTLTIEESIHVEI